MNKRVNVRRMLLKPLTKRRVAPAAQGKLDAALRDFTDQALAGALLPNLVAKYRARAGSKPAEIWKDPAATLERVELALALYRARRMSLQQYVFNVAHAVESFQDNRIHERSFPILEHISKKMRDVERSHGLSKDEYWHQSEAPPEYQTLANQWNAVEDVLLQEAFDEFEGGIAAELFRSNRAEFDRLRERGRRTFFHADEVRHAIVDAVIRYENEAEQCAGLNAFSGAITLLGAALEGLLLLRCLQQKNKATEAAKQLPKQLRPGSNNRKGVRDNFKCAGKGSGKRGQVHSVRPLA